MHCVTRWSLATRALTGSPSVHARSVGKTGTVSRHPVRQSDFKEITHFHRTSGVLIGYHPIHHLNSRIPNYHLAACYDEQPAFRHAVTFGLRDSLKCAAMKLWDADNRRMVPFSEAESRMVTDTPIGARRAA